MNIRFYSIEENAVLELQPDGTTKPVCVPIGASAEERETVGKRIADAESLREQVRVLREALKPFAAFGAEVLAAKSRLVPKTGEFYSVNYSGEPVSIDMEHFKAASAALAKTEEKR